LSELRQISTDFDNFLAERWQTKQKQNVAGNGIEWVGRNRKEVYLSPQCRPTRSLGEHRKFLRAENKNGFIFSLTEHF